MTMLVAAVVIAGLAVLVIGVLTGRVRVNGCCATADPRNDLRMRAAFADDEPDASAG